MLAVKAAPRYFHVGEQSRSLSLHEFAEYFFFFTCHIQEFEGRMLLLKLCRRPATWLCVIQAGEEAVVTNRGLGVSGSGVRKRRVERLMTSLK